MCNQKRTHHHIMNVCMSMRQVHGVQLSILSAVGWLFTCLFAHEIWAVPALHNIALRHVGWIFVSDTGLPCENERCGEKRYHVCTGSCLPPKRHEEPTHTIRRSSSPRVRISTGLMTRRLLSAKKPMGPRRVVRRVHERTATSIA